MRSPPPPFHPFASIPRFGFSERHPFYIILYAEPLFLSSLAVVKVFSPFCKFISVASSPIPSNSTRTTLFFFTWWDGSHLYIVFFPFPSLVLSGDVQKAVFRF